MGLFSKLKEIKEQNKETDITKMKFEHFTGFVGSTPQNFVNKSFPVCPVCKQNASWGVHVAQKYLKVFPTSKEEHTYHVKCDHCGMVMHTAVYFINAQPAYEVANPTPMDNVSVMTIDSVGDRAECADLVGKQMTIWQLNQLK